MKQAVSRKNRRAGTKCRADKGDARNIHTKHHIPVGRRSAEIRIISGTVRAADGTTREAEMTIHPDGIRTITFRQAGRSKWRNATERMRSTFTANGN